MTTVGCLRCGVWYDPGRPHLCGVLGDDIAKELEKRLDAFERRFQGLEVEARSRFNALERRVEELGAGDRRSNADEASLKPEDMGVSLADDGSRFGRDIGSNAPYAGKSDSGISGARDANGANAPPGLSGVASVERAGFLANAVRFVSQEEGAETPKPRFDRKANHKRHMREWRARQTALRRQARNV
jgi:hypothetical protein